MAKNKTVSSIDLNLTKAELESLLTDVNLELAFVVDSNHDGTTSSNLRVGEIRAKTLGDAATSDLNDSTYRPMNANITQYPLAGEFVVVMETPLGRFYLTSLNLFNNTSNNIDLNNTSGYVNFREDEQTNRKVIQSDKKNQKSVLDNNRAPFDTTNVPASNPFPTAFGDVNFYGRYGNRISLTRSEDSDPEMLLDNGVSSIELRNGSFNYVSKAQRVAPDSRVSTEINYAYEGEQIYLDSERVFVTAGVRGIFNETSGIYSILADDSIFIATGNDINMEGFNINLGKNANENVILGSSFLTDFERLMRSMVNFAQTLQQQDKILSLSHAANNFLTDLGYLGWDNFNSGQYLSVKVKTE